MKKLDHVILLTAMDAVSRLSGIKIDAQFTIESMPFRFPKLPEEMKTAARFNEYVEGKVIQDFYNNIIARFKGIATMYLDKNIRTKSIPDEEFAAIRKIFDDKVKLIGEEILEASPKDLKYYSCDLDWLESADEKLSCSFYLRSSINSCVQTIFNDIYDVIAAGKKIDTAKSNEASTPEPDPKPAESAALNTGKKFWSVNGGSLRSYDESDIKKKEEDTKADKSGGITTFPGYVAGCFSRKEKHTEEAHKDSQVEKKEEQDKPQEKKEEVKPQPQTQQNAKSESKEKDRKDSRRDNKPAVKSEHSDVEPDILEAPETPKKDKAPKIELQFPTPSDIQNMVSKPQQMVDLEAAIINPQYPDTPAIMKYFIIGSHVNISEKDVLFFEESLLTAADWVEDYDKSKGNKTATTFAFLEFFDVKNYVLARTVEVEPGKYQFMNPMDENYVIINVQNDSYNWYIKDDSNSLVPANIA